MPIGFIRGVDSGTTLASTAGRQYVFKDVQTIPNPVWEPLTHLPTKRQYFTGDIVDGKMYVIGAISSATATLNECYDIHDNSWSTKASIPTGTGYASCSAVQDNLYVICGQSPGGSTLDANQCYDTISDTWSTKTPMPSPMRMMSSSTIAGKIYIFGGQNDNGYNYGNYCYDVETGTWSSLSGMPTARVRLTSSVALGRIYAIGGYNTVGSLLGTNECYDPLTDTWSTMESMPTLRSDIASATVDDKIYVIGYTTANQCYDAKTGAWLTLPKLVDAIYLSMACTYGHKIYVPGNHNDSTSFYRRNYSMDVYGRSFTQEIIGDNSILFDRDVRIGDDVIPANTESIVSYADNVRVIFPETTSGQIITLGDVIVQ